MGEKKQDKQFEPNLGALNEQMKKIEKMDEKEEKEKEKKKLDFGLDKQKLRERIAKAKEIEFLKSLIERGLITPALADKISHNEAFSEADIEEIFEKIDEIEELGDKVLPAELRLTKKEYLGALHSEDEKQTALKKLNDALVHIYNQTNAGGSSPISSIFGFFGFLNENLVTAQENTIDIKRSLEEKK
ncbi:MAG: hypothetical protein N4A38_00105 [Candidatus Gracilibacteria bacterium]|nr:hypothetical protein [Candidatus Gracilibacteria bacterium]